MLLTYRQPMRQAVMRITGETSVISAALAVGVIRLRQTKTIDNERNVSLRSTHPVLRRAYACAGIPMRTASAPSFGKPRRCGRPAESV